MANYDTLLISTPHALLGRREVRFWAERGLVCCEDNDGDYRTISVRAFLQRLDAISAMLNNSTADKDKGLDADCRRRFVDILERGIVVARKAQEQGMPGDKSARHHLKIMRPTVMYTGHSSNSQM